MNSCGGKACSVGMCPDYSVSLSVALHAILEDSFHSLSVSMVGKADSVQGWRWAQRNQQPPYSSVGGPIQSNPSVLWGQRARKPYRATQRRDQQTGQLLSVVLAGWAPYPSVCLISCLPFVQGKWEENSWHLGTAQNPATPSQSTQLSAPMNWEKRTGTWL